MEAVYTIAMKNQIPILDLLNEDIDTIILLLNFFILLGQEKSEPVKTEAGKQDVIWDYI